MCKDKQNKEETKFPLWIWIIVAIIGVIALWLLSWWGISEFIDEPINRGTFGDMFGAVNALFSGLAFAGLIVTLLYQKEELQLQREELAETRKELNAQKLEFQEQNKTMKRQRFENTFFNMLSLQQEIVSNLSYEEEQWQWSELNNERAKKIKNYNAREVFEHIYTNAEIDYIKKGYYSIKVILEKHGLTAYSNIPEITRFDHYFRHLYHIFKYIDTSDLIEDKERYEYASIVRSQLSDYELVMLFYNCLAQKDSGIEENKFKPLIEKYAIFNNLRKDLLAKEEHLNEYNDGAYKKTN